MNNSRRFVLGLIVLSALVMIAPGAQVGASAYIADTASGTSAVSTVESFPYFDVSVEGCDVRQNGDRVDVTVSVSNNGSVSDTQTIELYVDEESDPRNTTELTVAADGSETSVLSWQDAAFGRVTVRAASDDASTETSLFIWWLFGLHCSVSASNPAGGGTQSVSASAVNLPGSVGNGTGPANTVPGGRPSGTSTNDVTGGETDTNNTTTGASDLTNSTGASPTRTNTTGGSTDSANSTGDGSSLANKTRGDVDLSNTTDGGSNPPNTTARGEPQTNSTDAGGNSTNSTSGESGLDDSTDVGASSERSTDEELTATSSTDHGTSSTNTTDVGAKSVNSTADGSGAGG